MANIVLSVVAIIIICIQGFISAPQFFAPDFLIGQGQITRTFSIVSIIIAIIFISSFFSITFINNKKLLKYLLKTFGSSIISILFPIIGLLVLSFYINSLRCAQSGFCIGGEPFDYMSTIFLIIFLIPFSVIFLIITLITALSFYFLNKHKGNKLEDKKNSLKIRIFLLSIMAALLIFQFVKYLPNLGNIFQYNSPIQKVLQGVIKKSIISDNFKKINPKDTNPQYEEQVRLLIPEHESLVKKLVDGLNGSDKESRMLDIFAPLGVLDPYADEENVTGEKDALTIHSIQNYEFGHFFNQYGFTEKETTVLAESPLKYGLTKFDYKDYFKQNQKKLDLLQTTTDQMTDLKIIGYWTSGLQRINNVFSDYKNKLIWKLGSRNGMFYDFSSIMVHNVDDPYSLISQDTISIQGLDTKKLDLLLNTIPTINVTTIYKCKEKTIYIMGATADNAFGFIHGASTAGDVNCGYLKNRFEIIKDEKLDDKWRFWIGR